MIISINLDPADVKRLDAIAGPRGRSKWVRQAITIHHTLPALMAWAEQAAEAKAEEATRRKATRRKAPTKKAKA